LDEVFAIADRVTVLKDGNSQGTVAIKDLTPGDLVTKMVGREVDLLAPRPEPTPPDGRVVLEVSKLNDLADAPRLRPRLRNINFSVRAGEIVGLAGLMGAGRTELALALFGVRAGVTGDVRVGGRHVVVRSPADAIAAGIGYVPEDRKEG
jgi:ABC-type sugar transport system ATPase subunit